MAPHTLDQPTIARPSPATWSAEPVLERLVEAFEVDRRMPAERRYGVLASAWPAAPIHEFTDIVHWDSGEQRERVWQSWERAPASPQEVTRMEESFGWLRWVPMVERKMLEAWASATARGLSVSAVIRKGGLSRTTFYRQRDSGAQRIADRLNAQAGSRASGTKRQITGDQ
jgi:hypothetical protein